VPSAYRDVWIGAGPAVARRVKIVRSFLQAGRPALIVEGAPDRTAVEALTGQTIFVERSRLEHAREPEALLYSDVEGAEVVDVSGTALGRVRGIYETGANPVAEVVSSGGERAVDIPLVALYVDFQKSRRGQLVLAVDGSVFEESWYKCDATR
jgi:16S rRNA processing protein RimM